MRRRRHISEHGLAYVGWCRDPARVEIAVVVHDGHRLTAQLTPGQARTLAIKLLTHAERAQRRGATALRIVKTEAKAKDIARELLAGYPEEYARGEFYEGQTGHTFRSPARDSWPASLAELRQHFEAGRVPRGVDEDDGNVCRVCAL